MTKERGRREDEVGKERKGRKRGSPKKRFRQIRLTVREQANR